METYQLAGKNIFLLRIQAKMFVGELTAWNENLFSCFAAEQVKLQSMRKL
ncbi:MAG: hypothetical protein WCS30_09080 [Selenomonadaceae bacterium]